MQLISRGSYDEPFRIRWEVPLGGTAEPAVVDVPYVATAGDTIAAPGSLVTRQTRGVAIVIVLRVPMPLLVVCRIAATRLDTPILAW